MYEKFGLMVKITSPEVIAFLRRNPNHSNTLLLENALRKKLGIPLKTGKKRHIGRKVIEDNVNSMPVKIKEPGLVEHIMSQKRNYGICHRHTVETAVLEQIRSTK